MLQIRFWKARYISRTNFLVKSYVGEKDHRLMICRQWLTSTLHSTMFWYFHLKNIAVMDKKSSGYQVEINFIHFVVVDFLTFNVNDDNCVFKILDPCPPFSQK